MDDELIHKELTEQIIGAAIEAYRFWGPGLYEEIDERGLCAELTLRKVAFENQLPLPLLDKGARVADDLQLDWWVEQKVVVEAKTVKKLLPVHEAQLLTYMRLTNSRVGLLINCNVALPKNGIVRRAL